jgi:iron(III) transport system ATP-binding protein
VTQLQSTTGSASSTAHALSVTGLRKAYGATTVLDGVDLAVLPGSLTAVLGRSGCGKTTLLRLVAGFDRPDDGTVVLDGREVTGPRRALPPEERRIGYVTQEGNLFPHLTVAANITFGLPRRARRARRRVAELLEMVGLDGPYADRYPHELSGGQQQRVALARALAPEPEIMLLDEPFTALDVDLREATREAVAAALAAAGTTTLLVTHDQEEALSMADRVAVMRDGRIAQLAPPAELYRHPVDRAVAAFVGDIVAVPGRRTGMVAECVLGKVPVVSGATPPDGPVTVLLRPEQISIEGPGPGVPARVAAVRFHGHDAMLRLVLDTGDAVSARCPGYAVPEPGACVEVVVRGEAGLDLR